MMKQDPEIMRLVFGLGFVAIIFVIVWITSSSEQSQLITNDSNIMSDLTFALESPRFEDGGMIPEEYTCDGENVSPPLSIVNAPEGVQSFALVVEDPDVPQQVREDQMFDHWIVYNIPSTITEIVQGEAPGTEGLNTTGSTGYVGPCPPTQYEPTEHRYVFRLFALDDELNLEEGLNKDQLLSRIEEHVLDEVTLTGRYDRTR